MLRSLKPFQRWLLRSQSRITGDLNGLSRTSRAVKVSQNYMDITAGQLIEHIRAFQLRYYPTGPLAGDDPNADAAAWPPKPGARTGIVHEIGDS